MDPRGQVFCSRHRRCRRCRASSDQSADAGVGGTVDSVSRDGPAVVRGDRRQAERAAVPGAGTDVNVRGLLLCFIGGDAGARGGLGGWSGRGESEPKKAAAGESSTYTGSYGVIPVLAMGDGWEIAMAEIGAAFHPPLYKRKKTDGCAPPSVWNRGMPRWENSRWIRRFRMINKHSTQ